jgi:hypothetical protein
MACGVLENKTTQSEGLRIVSVFVMFWHTVHVKAARRSTHEFTGTSCPLRRNRTYRDARSASVWILHTPRERDWYFAQDRISLLIWVHWKLGVKWKPFSSWLWNIEGEWPCLSSESSEGFWSLHLVASRMLETGKAIRDERDEVSFLNLYIVITGMVSGLLWSYSHRVEVL